jgi:hypothetical protein
MAVEDIAGHCWFIDPQKIIGNARNLETIPTRTINEDLSVRGM